MDSNTRITMKRISVICILCVIAHAAFSQFSIHVDTAKFISQTGTDRGKIFELVTYGNSDSLKLNGIKFYTSLAGSESDPVWLSDSSDYPKKTYADNRYEYKIDSGTYLTPGSDTVINGSFKFEDDALRVLGSGSAWTAIQGNATAGANTVQLPTGNGTLALTSDFTHVERYSAYSSGDNNVEVLADSTGVTASLTSSTLTFTIPSGVRLISVKIHLGIGFTTLNLDMGTADMGNSATSNRWPPICQAWRVDTGKQLTGVTTSFLGGAIPDGSFDFQKFTINGLMSGARNIIRLGF